MSIRLERTEEIPRQSLTISYKILIPRVSPPLTLPSVVIPWKNIAINNKMILNAEKVLKSLEEWRQQHPEYIVYTGLHFANLYLPARDIYKLYSKLDRELGRECTSIFIKSLGNALLNMMKYVVEDIRNRKKKGVVISSESLYRDIVLKLEKAVEEFMNAIGDGDINKNGVIDQKDIIYMIEIANKIASKYGPLQPIVKNILDSIISPFYSKIVETDEYKLSKDVFKSMKKLIEGIIRGLVGVSFLLPPISML